MILVHTMTAEAFAVHAARATSRARPLVPARARADHVRRRSTATTAAKPKAINAELTLPGVVTLAVKEGDETFVVAVAAMPVPMPRRPEASAGSTTVGSR